MDPDKIKAISDYFKKHFPDDDHKDMHEFDKDAQKFIVVTPKDVLVAVVARETIDDHNSQVILSLLDRHNIPDMMRNNPHSTIILRKGAVTIESRN